MFELGNEVIDRLLEKNIIFPESIVFVDEYRVPGHTSFPRAPLTEQTKTLFYLEDKLSMPPDAGTECRSASQIVRPQKPYACRMQLVRGCLAQFSASRRSARDNPEIRGSNQELTWHRAWCAGSCRADARDAAKQRRLVVLQAPNSDRSDTCSLLNKPAENTFYSVSIGIRRTPGNFKPRREEIRNARCGRQFRGFLCSHRRARRARSSGCERHRPG